MADQNFTENASQKVEDTVKSIVGREDTMLIKLWREHKLILIISLCAAAVAVFETLGVIYGLGFLLLADLVAVELGMKPKYARIKEEAISRLAKRSDGRGLNEAFFQRYTKTEISLMRFMLAFLTVVPCLLDSLLRNLISYNKILNIVFSVVSLAAAIVGIVLLYNINREMEYLDHAYAEKKAQNRGFAAEVGDEAAPFVE